MQINQNLTSVNRNIGSSTSRIKYIVVHYTGNDGDTAYNNTVYFKSVNRGASAHYFVDENSIWQCVADKDIAWHVGNDTYIHPYCRNDNSLGVEMCSRRDSSGTYYFKDGTVANTVELVKSLMKKYGVPIGNVIRHYDVTGKICPAPLVNTTAWAAFKKKLEVEDMTKAETQALIDTAVNPLKTQLAAIQKQLTAVTEKLDKLTKTYKYINEIPEWYREAAQYYVDKGVIQGKEDPAKHNGQVFVDLTVTECRLLTSMYRVETGIKLPEEPGE